MIRNCPYSVQKSGHMENNIRQQSTCILKRDLPTKQDENKNKKDDVDKINFTTSAKYLDGGIGWAAVFGCFYAHVLLQIENSVGILYVEIMESFEVTLSEVAWIGSIFVGTLCMGAPFMSSLEKFTTYRRMIICGCSLAFSGMILTYFVTNFPVIIFGFGVIQGIGNSMVFMASILVVNSYFDKKRPLAIAIGISGAGVGVALYPILEEVLLSTYGLRGTLLINSAISLNFLVCGALYFPQNYEKRQKFTKESLTEVCRLICDVNLFTNPFFIIFMFLNILSYVGTYVFVGFLPSYVVVSGYSTEDASLMVSISGVANSCSRLVLGYICCKLHQRKYSIYAVVFCGTSFSLIAVTFCDSYSTFMVTSLAYGIFSGGLVLMPAVVVGDLFDRSLLSSAYAMMTLAQGIGSFAGNPMAGTISEAANNDGVVFYVGGGVIFACNFLLIPLASRKPTDSQAKIERTITILVDKDKSIVIESDYNLQMPKDFLDIMFELGPSGA